MEQLKARLFDELTPLYPDTEVASGAAAYTVAGANGSYVGVHIAVSGLNPGYPLSFEVRGPHRAYKLFELQPVPVEVNTGADQRSEYLKDDHNEFVIRRAPFYIYDVEKPIFNLYRPLLPMAAFAFRTPIEYCREARTDDWQLILRHCGQEETLTLHVESHPAVIPKANKDTFRFINWFSFRNMEQLHDAPKWSPRYEEIMYKYFRAAVYTRQNMLAVPPGEVFDLNEKGEPVLNRAHIATLIRIAKKAGIGLFQGGAFCHRASGVADNDEFYNSLDHAHFTTPEQINDAFKEVAFDLFDHGTDAVFGMTGESMSGAKGQAQLRSALLQLHEWIEENDLKQDWVQCCLDEPNDALTDVYKIITDITKKAMPGVPVLEPVLPTEKVIGMVDIWCPTVYTYETNRKFFDDRVKNGDRLFVYTCLTPGGNYMNRLLDMERLRVVYLAWAPILYPNIEGFLHWGANQSCGFDPLDRQAAMFEEQVLEYHPKYANFLPAGDACIFYPGYNEPLISTRSEAHRIGFEDQYLLSEIAKKDRALALSIVQKLVRGYADYSKSVEEYRAVRKELLSQADRLL